MIHYISIKKQKGQSSLKKQKCQSSLKKLYINEQEIKNAAGGRKPSAVFCVYENAQDAMSVLTWIASELGEHTDSLNLCFTMPTNDFLHPTKFIIQIL